MPGKDATQLSLPQVPTSVQVKHISNNNDNIKKLKSMEKGKNVNFGFVYNSPQSHTCPQKL